MNLRNKQIYNFIIILLLSRGVIMIKQGDDYGHTQFGNNNPYNQDNYLSYFQWSLVNETVGGSKIYNLWKEMLLFRNKYKIFSSNDNYGYNDNITWLGIDGNVKDWSNAEDDYYNSFIAYKCYDYV